MEGCKQFNVLETEQWIAAHSAHGVPTKQRAEHQPPKGTYVIWVKCLSVRRSSPNDRGIR